MANEEQEHFLKTFNDPDAVARYSEGPIRFVPVLEALHRMTALLLAQNTPANARVLVLGARRSDVLVDTPLPRR